MTKKQKQSASINGTACDNVKSEKVHKATMREYVRNAGFVIKTHRRWIIAATVAVLLWGLFLFTMISNYERRTNLYISTELETLRSELDVSIKTYESFSKYVFEEIINKPEVLKLVAEAAVGDEQIRDLKRQELYQLLVADYSMLTEYRFRQLHFHFSDGVSFLRFHEPEKFGDRLFAVRDSIRVANQQQRYVSGFEEGRIFNGYRFVYPLRYEDRHIGTVEVSISMDYLMSMLNQLYPDNDLYFMLRRDVVEDLVFEDMQDNYRQSPFSPDYLFDKAVGAGTDKYRQSFALNESLNQKIEEAARGQILKQGDFGFFIENDDIDVEVRFLSIKNIVGKHTAYIVSLREDQNFSQMRFDHIKDIILITLILFMFVILSFFYNRERIKLQKLSYSDSLTGIYNRYMFLCQAEKEFERYKRYGSVFSITMIDIDHFKKVNDTYGHSEGDFVLREVTRIINDNLRKTDVFARWGGEEFIVMMPETRSDGAYSAAEKLRAAIACHQFGMVGQVTISLGVAMIGEQDKSLELLISRADEKLYEAKRAGRNRTET